MYITYRRNYVLLGEPHLQGTNVIISQGVVEQSWVVRIDGEVGAILC